MKKNMFKKITIFIVLVMVILTEILPTSVNFGATEDEYEELAQQYEAFKDLREKAEEENSQYLIEGITNPGKYIIYDKSSGLPVQSAYGAIWYIDMMGNRQYCDVLTDNGTCIEIIYPNYFKYYTNGNYSLENVESESGKTLVETYNNGLFVLNGEVIRNDDASIIESVISHIILLVLRCFYTLVCLVVGEPFSIELVIFDKYPNTKLAFFTKGIESLGDNPFISNSGIRTVLSYYFSLFTKIAIVVYLIILVYMGIRILLDSTSKKAARYKELSLYWLEGVLILALFPYIMKYSIQINSAILSFIYENKNAYLSSEIEMPVANAISGGFESFGESLKQVDTFLNAGQDFMSVIYMQANATGWLVYTICFAVMLFQMVGFLIVYFKRVLIMLFLIAIFPLVSISYAIDKIGDGKSQAFNNWTKEFLVNLFNQTFHAITYVFIMALITKLLPDPSKNWLLMLIAISFLSKGDDILRGIFSISSSADTMKSVGASFMKATAAVGTVQGIKSIGNRLVGKGSGINKMGGAVNRIGQRAWNMADNKTKITETGIKIRENQSNMTDYLKTELLPSTNEEALKNDIDNKIKTLLGKNSNASKSDIINSSNSLLEYLNGDDVTKSVAKGLIDSLTDDERQKLEHLLNLGAATNAVMVAEYNIKNNIDAIIKRTPKEIRNSKEGQALLGTIADGEEDLKRIRLLEMKFKEDDGQKKTENVFRRKKTFNSVGKDDTSKTSVENNLEPFSKVSYRGRAVAEERTKNSNGAKSALEARLR